MVWFLCRSLQILALVLLAEAHSPANCYGKINGNLRIGVLVDNDFVTKANNLGQSSAETLAREIVQNASMLYEANFGFGLTVFEVVRLELGCIPRRKWETTMYTWHHKDNRASQGAVYVRFSGCAPKSGTVGLAWIGWTGRKSLIFVTTDRSEKPTENMWYTFVHELGHSLGADHLDMSDCGEKHGIMCPFGVGVGEFLPKSQKAICANVTLLNNREKFMVPNCSATIKENCIKRRRFCAKVGEPCVKNPVDGFNSYDEIWSPREENSLGVFNSKGEINSNDEIWSSCDEKLWIRILCFSLLVTGIVTYGLRYLYKWKDQKKKQGQMCDRTGERDLWYTRAWSCLKIVALEPDRKTNPSFFGLKPDLKRGKMLKKDAKEEAKSKEESEMGAGSNSPRAWPWRQRVWLFLSVLYSVATTTDR